MRKPRQKGSSSGDPEAEASGKARGLSRKSTREAPSNRVGGQKIRCAIYTRKSSEEGLEQEFNSLDAQREACEAYIKSQRHEGWSVLPQLYDDPGYSGGTMERPALKRLLADIAGRRVDAVVVYKVDRLTRSLADFAKIVEVFDAHGISFVSITQAFNTTISMGRGGAIRSSDIERLLTAWVGVIGSPLASMRIPVRKFGAVNAPEDAQ